MYVSTGLLILGLVVLGWQSFQLLMALFEPGLRYRIQKFDAAAIDSELFLQTIEALTDAQVNHRSSVAVLTNGEQFYAAQLEAIRSARTSVNLEAYIFQRGKVAHEFLAALAERARAGAKVNVIMDGIGSLTTRRSYCRELIEAGGRLEFYHPFSWKSIARINNRTHRELLVVDGQIGFLGGAGIADHWLMPGKKHPRWRDTVVRVEGDVVCNLQATFAENWLESRGEVIFGEEYFPFCEARGGSKAMVINSAPSVGGSTRARILFQALVSAAQKSIRINSPYFLPDSGMVSELVRAVKRGVEVKIIVPGKKSDHILTRSSSRRLYGPLLQAGARIFEYQPGMIHAKILIVDGLWSVVGSTNFDNRSFGLNDEVNMAVRDEAVAERLETDFVGDLQNSREISLSGWRQRSIFERLNEVVGRVLERQQ
ncbi:MAG TPA: phospholipase D-like domain-containing protein [Candidatus Angelobacter sp.]|nr:phospholipase D-like domain-containing protein [Candidatus Angelobacter sp.]